MSQPTKQRRAPVDRQRLVLRRKASIEAGVPSLPAIPKNPLPKLPAAAPDALAAEFEAAQQRMAEMTSIAQFAEKHSVAFDLKAAIRSRMTCAEARNQVMDCPSSEHSAQIAA